MPPARPRGGRTLRCVGRALRIRAPDHPAQDRAQTAGGCLNSSDPVIQTGSFCFSRVERMYPLRLTPGPLPRDLEEHLHGLITSEVTPTIPVEAPFDATTIGHIPEGGQSCVDKAFSLAREAQRGWQDTPHATRRSIVRTFHSLVLTHRELLMDMVQLETGKNRAAAFDEVMDVASTARYYAARAEKLLTPRRRQGTIP